MKYGLPGPEVISGVSRERILLYNTTMNTCGCASNTFNPGPCKHIKAARHGCSCPESLMLSRTDRGIQLVCAEACCEYGRLRRQALLNDGWREVAEGPSYKVCFVCETEILPNVSPAESRMRYCYKGDHWLRFICSTCGDLADGIGNDGEPSCNAHLQSAQLPIAV